MKQTIGNACGTIGVLHSLANNQDAISVSKHISHCTDMPVCRTLKESLESGKTASYAQNNCCCMRFWRPVAEQHAGLAEACCGNMHDRQLHPAHAAGKDSFLQRFLTATADMDAAQRGAYLEDPPEGAPDIDQAHHVSCLEHVSSPWLR